MKKISMTALLGFCLVLQPGAAVWQDQAHDHTHSNRRHYEERLQRYTDRMYWQMPLRVMNELGIGPGMSVADVGAGIGYFTLKLAERVGEAGKVYASDIDRNALSFLDERRQEAGLENISIIQGRADDPLIPDASVDLVLIVNTIQFVEDTTAFLHNLRACLKDGGRVVFVQWAAEKMDSELPGWSKEDREKYTLRTMLRMIFDARYEVLEIKDFLPMQRIYICRPRDAD